MIVKLLTEHHLEFLSLKGGCRGSSESTLAKMSNCWKSRAAAHISCHVYLSNLPKYFHGISQNQTIDDLEQFVANHHTVDEDFMALHSIIMKYFDKHAPVKRRRVKCNRLPEWYTSGIGLTRSQRDKCKHQNRRSQYERL